MRGREPASNSSAPRVRDGPIPRALGRLGRLRKRVFETSGSGCMNGYDYLPWVVVLLVVLFCAWQQLRFQREADQRRQAEVTLRSAETMLQRMHQAIESASDAIGIGDSEGTSVYHNRAHAALFGYSVEELNAVPGSGVLLADANQAQEIFGCLRQGRSWSGEADVKTKAGRRIPAFVRMLSERFGADKLQEMDVFTGVASGLAVAAAGVTEV